MLNIPYEIRTTYDALLAQCTVPPQQRSIYKKWLRYYLDFCHKYHFAAEQQASLSAFVEKLHSKRQSEILCEQARQAVLLYYELDLKATLSQAEDTEPNHREFHADVAQPQTKYAELKQAGASWVEVYEDLNAEIKLRHYSPKTLKAYRTWMRKFQAFVKSKESRLLTQQDVKDFLTHLAVEKKVAASTQNQAFNALLFLFKHVLKQEFGEIQDVPRAKRSSHIPVVLSRKEVDVVIEHLSQPFVLPVKFLYGCGLRISECLNLRLHNFNLDEGMLTVHDGKGKKDRTMPLPQSIMPEIKQQFERVSTLYEADMEVGSAGVFLPDNLGEKYKNAGKDFIWQWFFPAKSLTLVSETKEYKRYHLHDTQLQKSIRMAAKRAKLLKRVSAHTFRHSFASHLLQANYDIRTIQALMGHSHVKTTMIYMQTVPSLTLKEAKSPLDF